MGESSKIWKSDVIKSSTYAIISELSKLRVQLRRTSAKPRNTCSWRLTFPVVKDRFKYLCLRVSFCLYSAYFDFSSPLLSSLSLSYNAPACMWVCSCPLLFFCPFFPYVFLSVYLYFLPFFYLSYFSSTFSFHFLSSFFPGFLSFQVPI